MSAPATKEEWDAVARELAEYRAGRSAVHFPHAFGLEPEALRDWCLEDAADTMRLLGIAGDLAAPALATHTQIGIELGLFLVMTGRVTP